MGSLDGARRALDWIAAFEPNWVVPGRGPVVSAQQLSGVLEAHRRYYRLVVDTAQAGPRDGLSPLEAAVGCDLGPFSALPDSERIVLNLHRAYCDLGDRAFDLVGAFTDAVACNHGAMPRMSSRARSTLPDASPATLASVSPPLARARSPEAAGFGGGVRRAPPLPGRPRRRTVRKTSSGAKGLGSAP